MKISKSLFIIFTLSLVQPVIADEKQYPITILKPIEFKNEKISGVVAPKDIGRISNLEVSLKENKETQGVNLTDLKSKKEQIVKTCSEYQKLKNGGWFAASTFDIAMESYFNDSCDIIDIIRKASTSKNSNFFSLPKKTSDLENYPAEILDLISIGEEGLKTCEGAKTFSQCAKIRHGKISFEGNEIQYEDADYKAFFIPVLRADINKDGFEDLVYTYAYYVNGGTFRAYNQVCLEWPNKSKNTAVIKCK